MPLMDLPTEVLQSPRSQPFIRRDRKNWNKIQFLLVGWFLLPIKIVVFFGGAVSFAVISKLILIINQTKVENAHKDPQLMH